MRFMNLLVFGCLSCLLVVPGSYFLLTLALACAGLFSLNSLRSTWSEAWSFFSIRWISMGAALYVLVVLFIGWWHGYTGGYYDAIVPFILAPFVIHGVVSSRIKPDVFWLGCASGAIASGLYASYQSLILNIGRAIGSLNNQIMFGDLSVVLACVALFGLLYFDKTQLNKWVRSFLLLGALLGIWASLMSGSKGGWLSIITITLVFGWRISSYKGLLWQWTTVSCVLLILFSVVFFAPKELVINRIVDGIDGAVHWFKTGEITDGSTSIRLEYWQYGFQLFMERPLLGWSASVASQMLFFHLESIGTHNGFGVVFENDLIQFAATAGLIGLLGFFALFSGLFKGFLDLSKSSDLAIKGFAVVGMILVILFFEFGLTVNVLTRNAFRHVFVTFSVILLGLSLLRLQSAEKDA